MKEKAKVYLEELIKTIKKPEMSILPGQLAFFFVLSIIPLIALLGSIASIFSISIDTIKDLISSSFPKEVASLLIPIVSGKSVNINMVVFFVSAFFLASNGTNSMIITSNTIYKIENKSYIHRRIKAITMTVILVSLLIFVLIVPAFGDTIFDVILKFSNEQKIVTMIYKIYQIAKYPLSIFLIYFDIKLLYTIAPDDKIKSKDTTRGALLTTIIWIIATEVYSIYVEVFTRYDIFYGSISNILILLLWVYILAYVFVLGMAFNATTTNTKNDITS